MTRALITGIGGQDGSYLADLLLAKGYEVHGVVLPSFLAHPSRAWRLAHCLDRVCLHAPEPDALGGLVRSLIPDEVYHLTGTRMAIVSDAQEGFAFEQTLAMTRTLLSALHACRPEGAFFFAASSEMFGPASPAPQDEQTPLDPQNIYAIAKEAGFRLVRYYREAKGLRACSGILFNHESPRRSEDFVSRKITLGAAHIKLGLQDKLHLGNLEARRDWGHARHFTEAMWRMLQQPVLEDLVLATGQFHTVGDWVRCAFERMGLETSDHLTLDGDTTANPEVVRLGNPARAQQLLDWEGAPAFEEMVAEMVEADLERVREESQGAGRKLP